LKNDFFFAGSAFGASVVGAGFAADLAGVEGFALAGAGGFAAGCAAGCWADKPPAHKTMAKVKTARERIGVLAKGGKM